ncbi:unnamed protein product, partial [Ixodes persulcatus]
QGVPSEVGRVLVQAELLVELGPRRHVAVHVLPRLGVVHVVILHKHQEIAEAALLEDPHQTCGFLLVGGHLVDLAARFVHVAAFHRLELEVARHPGVDQKLHQLACTGQAGMPLTVGHEELGDEVHVPVPRATILVRLLEGWHVELAKEVLQRRDGGTLPAVILVAVHVQHLLPTHGQHATQDALLTP